MKVKTFHALTMQDAIRAIKEELGPDAVILSSKEVHQGGRLMSYFNKPVLEVMQRPDMIRCRRSSRRGTRPPRASHGKLHRRHLLPAHGRSRLDRKSFVTLCKEC